MAEFEDYLRNSDKYWGQALESLKKGEFEKASEFAWGSVAARIKALALAETRRLIRSHRDLGDYVKKVSSQIGNEGMYQLYREVEGLHSNFYESGMDPDDVRETIRRTEKLILDIDRVMLGR